MNERIKKALSYAWSYGQIGGDHHKMWVIDQMVRALLSKEEYKEQILKMQGLISSVTDLGVKLTALEEKNRASLELLFQGRKNNIRQFKIGKQAADKYYKNMIGLTSEKSYFMDHKK